MSPCLSGGFRSVSETLLHSCALAWSLQEAAKDVSGPLLNKFSNRSFYPSSWDTFLFYFCYELTVWILEAVILIDQTSNRELSASPDSLESEIVLKLGKFPTERGAGGSSGAGGGLAGPGPDTVSLSE